MAGTEGIGRGSTWASIQVAAQDGGTLPEQVLACGVGNIAAEAEGGAVVGSRRLGSESVAAARRVSPDGCLTMAVVAHIAAVGQLNKFWLVQTADAAALSVVDGHHMHYCCARRSRRYILPPARCHSDIASSQSMHCEADGSPPNTFLLVPRGYAVARMAAQKRSRRFRTASSRPGALVLGKAVAVVGETGSKVVLGLVD